MKGTNMKNIFLAAVFALAPIAAHADTKYATITSVEPRYDTVYQNVPTTQCQNVQVPVYGTVQGNGASGGDVLAGMIIGGILGKGITGNDNGAAAGAVMGGVIAADNQNRNRQVVTGYRTERQCTEVMQRQAVTQIRDYLISFEWRGMYGSAYTYNTYNVGDLIPVTVSVVAQ